MVKALRRLGCSVAVLSSLGNGLPDLLVGFRGRNFLLELKDGDASPSDRRLTEEEEIWASSWRGQVETVAGLEDAVELLEIEVANIETVARQLGLEVRPSGQRRKVG